MTGLLKRKAGVKRKELIWHEGYGSCTGKDGQGKEQAQEILEQLGVDIPSAIRMFFKAVVRENGLPLQITTLNAHEKENEKTDTFMQVIEDIFGYRPNVNLKKDRHDAIQSFEATEETLDRDEREKNS